MEYYDAAFYRQELEEIAGKRKKTFKDKSILVTGARGMIGSMFIDVIMLANAEYGTECKVYAVVRDETAARKRFRKYINDPLFKILVVDVNQEALEMADGNLDFIVHGASNTHPLLYSRKPIETILTNSVGTNNILKCAVKYSCKRFLFLSSVEIYGENRGDGRKWDENGCGYINSNTLRAGYPEGKRLGEALCQAYRKEYGLKSIILRIARCYGPGILENDSKALSQFLQRAKEGKDIILKSEGKQFFSYIYQADVVDAIFHFLQYGEEGEAYNITGGHSDITLKELAEMIAGIANVSVRSEVPDEEESVGYSKASRALLDGEKAAKAGWMAQYKMPQGIERCLHEVVSERS